MADSISLRVEGQSELETFLARLLGKLGDLTPLMQDIGALLETSTADNFDAEASPAGVPWKKSARAIETGGKTLQDSRRLRLSITSIATASSVEAGSNVAYARRHNQGFSGTEQVSAHTVANHKRVMREVFGVTLDSPIIVTVAQHTRKAHSRKANTPRRQFLGLGPHDVGDIEALATTYLDVEA